MSKKRNCKAKPLDRVASPPFMPFRRAVCARAERARAEQLVLHDVLHVCLERARAQQLILHDDVLDVLKRAGARQC